MKPVYYSSYLQLDKILNAQQEESKLAGVTDAHDEMLFIIIHQAYELWFKQIIHELNIVRSTFAKENIDDNSDDLNDAAYRLHRIITIQELLVKQMDVMETMSPMHFLDFRDFLRPASGFQSIQFKILEAALGLPFDTRHGQAYYLSQLTPEDVARVKNAEAEVPLIALINNWLERMPFNSNEAGDAFWRNYRAVYESTLQDAEKQNMLHYDECFVKYNGEAKKQFSEAANRSALFIMLYKHYPMLQQPYQVLSALLEIDSLLSQWRYRHMNMVQRMIGRRVGTGGSTGAAYLKGAADSHQIFGELAAITSYLVQKSKLPTLPTEIVAAWSFKG